MVAELVTTENTDKLTCQLDQNTVEELKATETKAPEYIGAAAGKYHWDDRSSGDADKHVGIDLYTNTGMQRVLVRVKGKSFGLSIQKTDV